MVLSTLSRWMLMAANPSMTMLVLSTAQVTVMLSVPMTSSGSTVRPTSGIGLLRQLTPMPALVTTAPAAPSLTCGMDADGGKSKYDNAGAQYGTGYCDAQCPM